jgi:DNA-binding CsgD family transcriptional regulator
MLLGFWFDTAGKFSRQCFQNEVFRTSFRDKFFRVRGNMAMREPVRMSGGRIAMKSASAASPHWVGSSAGSGVQTKPAAAVAGQRFTAEESILLRSLATGNTVKEMAGQLRLPRESLFRLLGDLRRKTGVADDTALAVWVLRNMGTSDRRGGDR